VQLITNKKIVCNPTQLGGMANGERRTENLARRVSQAWPKVPPGEQGRRWRRRDLGMEQQTPTTGSLYSVFCIPYSVFLGKQTLLAKHKHRQSKPAVETWPKHVLQSWDQSFLGISTRLPECLGRKPRASQKFQAEKPTHPEQRTAAQLFSSSGGSTSYKAFVNSICICINIVQYDLYNMGCGLYTRTP